MSEESVPVTTTFKTKNGFKHVAATVAESNCWSMLKGGLTGNASGPAQLYFEVTISYLLSSTMNWMHQLS